MRLLWGVCLWLLSATSSSWASGYPDCPNLSEDKINALKQLTVTEDVHDKLVGDYTEVWGPSEVIDLDRNACIRFHRERADPSLLQVMTADTQWFGGKRLINLTLERVENGIYLARKDGVVKSVFFILYAQNHVVTHYAWEACSRDLNAPPVNNKRYINYVTGVSVDSNHVTSALHPDTQAALDHTLAVIRGHKDLLGDISPLSNFNC